MLAQEGCQRTAVYSMNRHSVRKADPLYRPVVYATSLCSVGPFGMK